MELILLVNLCGIQWRNGKFFIKFLFFGRELNRFGTDNWILESTASSELNYFSHGGGNVYFYVYLDVTCLFVFP